MMLLLLISSTTLRLLLIAAGSFGVATALALGSELFAIAIPIIGDAAAQAACKKVWCFDFWVF